MSDYNQRQAQNRLIETLASDNSLSRESNIQSARRGLDFANSMAQSSADRLQARDDRFRDTPNQQMSSSGSSAGGGILLVIAGIVWAISIVIQIVYSIFMWLAAHVWNIVGAGMILGGIYGLYLLASHYYWKHRYP